MSYLLPAIVWVMSMAGAILLILLISNPLIRYINDEVNSLSSLHNPPVNKVNYKKYKKIKRTVDVLVSSLILLLILPIILLIVLILYETTEGPVFSFRIVTGENGRHFKLYSFAVYRRQKRGIIDTHIPPNRPPFTAIGRFLYVTSLAYFPAFYNVLIGDLSLVGISAVNNYVETKDYLSPAVKSKLLEFKPGLLSLYSVSKDRTIDDFHKMQLFDLYYIQHISFKTDFLIFLSGLIKVLAKPTYQEPISKAEKSHYFTNRNIHVNQEN